MDKGLGRRVCRRPLGPRIRNLKRKGQEIVASTSIAIRENSFYWVPFSTALFLCVCWLPRRLCSSWTWNSMGVATIAIAKNSNKFIFNFSYPINVSRAHTLHNSSHETPLKSIKMKSCTSTEKKLTASLDRLINLIAAALIIDNLSI